MANISWSIRRNLENSLVEFLQAQTIGVTVFYKGKDETINITVGHTPKDSWDMPIISLYTDPKTSIRSFIGNNKRLDTYLMILDVRALDDGMRSDLASWVTTAINDGFDLYDYTPGSGDVENPTKVLSGKVSVNFVSDVPVRNTQNSNVYEKWRQNISINVTVAV